MTRDYGSRQAIGNKSKASHVILVGVLSFSLGYLSASFIQVDSLSQWLNTKIAAIQADKVPEPKPVVHHAHAAKPKFEFYTLLTKDKETSPAQQKPDTPAPISTVASLTVTPQPVEEAKPKPVSKQEVVKTATKGAFQVQVASFRVRKDADQMKALLTLKGYAVVVVPVNTTKGYWFRVIIGPYANRMLAQKAQGVLAKSEHLNGMIIAVL